MDTRESFRNQITQGYTFKGDSIVLGTSMLNGETLENNQVKAPLKTFNRHGLIAGATGTGKTKTLQNLAERLSENGVPLLLMDVKGDLSGITQPGTLNPNIEERHKLIGFPWQPEKYPAELLTISEQRGVRMRATISEFGPVLLSKIFGLNDTQASVISLVFKYCDDRKLPLLDIKDFRKTLQYITSEGKEELEKEYGLVSTSTIGAIMRKLIEIEEQGADLFFGERSFDVNDLLRLDSNGKGYINILRLDDIQSKPKLFSTFMLCLLAEIYETFPERGDADRPELVIFIDEAHLIFEEASSALLNQIETIVKLIRSKGVGLFFITQSPADVPASVLSQLGMKIQHALRAFTANDRKDIKLASENYPISEYYTIDEVLTQMGIGEAFVTVLNEKGIPTPLVHTLLTAPRSRMDVITESEKDQILRSSVLMQKYEEVLDRESAYELLNKKIETASSETPDDSKTSSGRQEKSTFQEIAESSLTRTIVREVARGIFGVLGFGGRGSSSIFGRRR
jgi:DNA helicase HerA-like ATPase